MARPLSTERDSQKARLAAVTLDCWQTLLVETDAAPARAARTQALQALARRNGRTLRERGAQEVLDACWRRHTQMWEAHAAVGAREMAGWCLEALGLPGEDIADQRGELAEQLAQASLTSDIRPLDGARETLAWLRAAEIPAALVCDTGYTPGPVLRRILERTGLLSGLAVQVFSDEVGVPKPERAIFDAALKALGVQASQTLHVGDLKRTDVAGARALGIRSIRIRQTHDDPSTYAEADQVVDSHAQLRAVLAALLSR